MSRAYSHINVEQYGDVFVVSLRSRRLLEKEIHETADEVVSLIVDEGCRKLIFSLGPGTPSFLYSVFLAKLVMFRRYLEERGGTMKLCDVTPDTYSVFEACKLHDYFDFLPDKAAALAAFGVTPPGGPGPG
jgi:hypothetical protein